MLCRGILHAVTLRHGTDGFTSPPPEVRASDFYHPQKSTALGRIEKEQKQIHTHTHTHIHNSARNRTQVTQPIGRHIEKTNSARSTDTNAKFRWVSSEIKDAGQFTHKTHKIRRHDLPSTCSFCPQTFFPTNESVKAELQLLRAQLELQLFKILITRPC
jgi:hypothetical protein